MWSNKLTVSYAVICMITCSVGHDLFTQGKLTFNCIVSPTDGFHLILGNVIKISPIIDRLIFVK